MLTFLSEYFNEDGDRRSEIYLDPHGVYHVHFYRGQRLIEDRPYPEKHLCFVEDAADNWIRGIMKL